MYNTDFSLLTGKTLTKIEKDCDEITFYCDDKSVFRAYHMQDCCETVLIHDIIGNLNDLIGSPLTSAYQEINDEHPSVNLDDIYDSYTITVQYLRTKDARVEIVWLGQSNGYYSESVYFTRTHEPINVK